MSGSFGSFSIDPTDFKNSRSHREYFIFVKTLTGKTSSLSVTPCDTVHDVKLKLQDKLGCDVESQKIIYNGKLLINNMATLEFLDIGNESMIHLIVAKSEPVCDLICFNPNDITKKYIFLLI